MTERMVVGITGGTGSGKTTAAKYLAGKWMTGQTTIISFDDYYRDQPGTTLEERAKTNYDHPDSLDFELLIQQLTKLKGGGVIEKPLYNFSTHSRKAETETVKPTKMIIVEGILALHFPKLRELYDYRIFMDAPSDIRFIRRLQRDTMERGRSVESVIKQYLETVRPMHEAYVEPTKKYADYVVSGIDGKLELEQILKRLE